jgi:hypothetical protein
VLTTKHWEQVNPSNSSGCNLQKLHDLYSSSNIIQIFKAIKIRWTGHVAHIGEKRNTYRVWEVNRPLERCRHRYMKNTEMDLKEKGKRGMR